MSFTIGQFRRIIREAAGDAYRVLDVDHNASQEEIKAAYRKLSIALHPDRNPDKDTTAAMARVNIAYALLGDPQKRARYNVFGDKTMDGTPAPMPQRQPPPRQSPPPPQPQQSRSRTDWGQGSSSSGSYRREFVYINARSRKFWIIDIKQYPTSWAVITTYGRLSTRGSMTAKNFRTLDAAKDFYHHMIDQKLRKGYRERSAQSQYQPPPHRGEQAPPPNPQPPPPTSKNTEDPPQRKPPAAGAPPKSYKIYGRSPKGAKAHTRYKGVVFGAPSDTKFKNGMSATVAMGTDGRLSVHNSETGHTQFWTSESFANMAAELIIESLEVI